MAQFARHQLRLVSRSQAICQQLSLPPSLQYLMLWLLWLVASVADYYCLLMTIANNADPSVS